VRRALGKGREGGADAAVEFRVVNDRDRQVTYPSFE
jgi:hypothetical protein